MSGDIKLEQPDRPYAVKASGFSSQEIIMELMTTSIFAIFPKVILLIPHNVV
jgi:hypothetical protein